MDALVGNRTYSLLRDRSALLHRNEFKSGEHLTTDKGAFAAELHNAVAAGKRVVFCSNSVKFFEGERTKAFLNCYNPRAAENRKVCQRVQVKHRSIKEILLISPFSIQVRGPMVLTPHPYVPQGCFLWSCSESSSE